MGISLFLRLMMKLFIILHIILDTVAITMSKLYLTLLQVFYYHMVIIFTKMYSFITLSKEVLDIVNFTMISLYVQCIITWTCMFKVILIMMMLSFDMQQIRILILIL